VFYAELFLRRSDLAHARKDIVDVMRDLRGSRWPAN
jgi:hypothetical protein